MNLSTDIETHARAPETAGVEPARGGDSDSTSSDSDRSARASQPLKNLWEKLSDIGARMRRASIAAMPAFLVNNSSNVLGFSHVLTEFVMFKAGIKGNKLIDNPQNPINWVVEPVKKVAADIYTNSKSRDYSLKQLFTGNVSQNVKKYIVDTKAATLREVSRQSGSGKSISEVALGNPWQTRTTFAGLVVWTLSALLPEHKDSEEEVERMATMRTLHPFKYAAERMRQAVWFPEWTSHKRQMIGLGYLVIGICSMLGSFRQRRDLKHEIAGDAEMINMGLKQAYGFNAAYFGTSVLSFLSSLPLLFALDENKAYSVFGMTMMLRIPVMFKSISKKYEFNEPGKHSYTAGMVSFQLENAAQALIGGATKLPDGTIVDHEAEKRRAISEAKEYKKAHKKPHKPLIKDHPTIEHNITPHPTVTQAKALERLSAPAPSEEKETPAMA
jgi:hypothetical protein